MGTMAIKDPYVEGYETFNAIGRVNPYPKHDPETGIRSENHSLFERGRKDAEKDAAGRAKVAAFRS